MPAAARVLEALFSADVTDLLPSIDRPALVIHYSRDRAVPFRGGEHIAALLPNTRFLPLDGAAHLPRGVDLDRVLRRIAGFLRGD